MQGKKDDELQTRWVQYGVFSPIMRLHSTANPWNTKEPWSFGSEHCAVQSKFLRWRHKLLPYLQTMNVRVAQHGLPLCQPIYWLHPEDDEAYQVPNEYMFGNSLIVAPLTSPRSSITRLARTKAWLPLGIYVDLFTGTAYSGNRSLWLNRTLEEYPVLAPLGTILPLDGSDVLKNGCPIPQHLENVVIPGADGDFDLLEEQPDAHGVASLERISKTSFNYSQTRGELVIGTPALSTGLPQNRSWNIRFHACRMPSDLKVTADDEVIDCIPNYTPYGFTLKLKDISIGRRMKIDFSEPLVLEPAPYLDRCSDILFAAQIEYNLKEKIWNALTLDNSGLLQASRLDAIDMEKDLLGALLEQIYASGL